MNRPGRSVRILSTVAYIVAGLLAAAGIIVGLIPYNVAGFDAVCASALGHLTGAITPLQSVADRLASAPCVNYEGQMTVLMFILLGAAVIALVAGLMAGSWARRVKPADTPTASGQTEAVAQPTHFPLSANDQDAVSALPGPRPASED